MPHSSMPRFTVCQVRKMSQPRSDKWRRFCSPLKCRFCQSVAWWLTLRAIPTLQSGTYTGSSAQLSKQGIIAVAVLVPLCTLLLLGLALHLAAKHGLLCNRPASPEARAEGAEAGLGQGDVPGKPAPAGVQVRVDAT